MNPDKEHNFYLKTANAKPGLNLWRCDDCDSEVLWSIKYTQIDVNQLMMVKMACLNEEMFIN